MKKGLKKLWIVLGMLCIVLYGCASKEDKNAAQYVIDQINEIDTVTIESANHVYDIQNEYNLLSDKQKKLVNNYDRFTEIKIELERLVIEEEIKNDPTNTITESELIGIWEEDDSSDTHRGYLYFTKQGYIYYIASKKMVMQSDFTDEYLISTKYLLSDYNRTKRKKEGEFYCIPSKSDYTFGVTKLFDGEMTLEVTGKTLEGT